MPYVLLPNLSDPPFYPQTAGVWEDAKGKTGMDIFLRGLADSLKGTQNTDKVMGIDSIPDVWARPLFFQMALFSSKNFDENLRNKAVGEWRALLSILALNKIRRLNLEVIHIELDASGALGKDLIKLAPRNVSLITPPTNDLTLPWKDIYAITYDGKPLAITSPTTLVSPAADYAEDFAEDFTEGLKGPWKNDDILYLTDPLKNTKSPISEGEILALYAWLTDLKSELDKIVNNNVTDTIVSNALFALLGEYINDVQNVKGKAAGDVKIIDAGFNINIGVASCLGKTAESPSIPVGTAAAVGGQSISLLKTSTARAGSAPLIVFRKPLVRPGVQ